MSIYQVNGILKCLFTLKRFFFFRKYGLLRHGFVDLGSRPRSALAPRLAPILLFSDLLEIESALPKIKTAQLEIEIALLEIEILSNKVANNYQPDEGLIVEV